MASSPTVAQMTVEEARQEGRVLGNEKRQDSTLVPTDSARAEAVPGDVGTSLPQGAYFDNPERMETEATASKSSNKQYRITTDADRTRPTFSNAENLETTTRAPAVEKDPAAFLEGEEMSSASGGCTPLPAATGGAGYYEATHNEIGRAPCRERVCQYVCISGGAVSLKKKKTSQ